MKILRFCLISLLLLIILVKVVPQEGWPEVTPEMKPWTRWWWMGSAVDQSNLEKELRLLADAGFGGVEITPIYGAKGFEEKYIPFLSEEWMNMLRHTVSYAQSQGMGVDIISVPAGLSAVPKSLMNMQRRKWVGRSIPCRKKRPVIYQLRGKIQR